MLLSHRDNQFQTVELADLQNFTLTTNAGATISVSESSDGTLYLHEGSHRSFRIIPVVSNAVRLEVFEPFLEAAAPMSPLNNMRDLNYLAPGSKLYSVKTQTIWTWHGGNNPTPEGFIITNTADDSGFTETPEFWAAAAPLLLAAKP